MKRNMRRLKILVEIFIQNNKIIIIFEIPIEEFHSGYMRNTINAALDFNHVPVVATTVIKTVRNNIAITTMQNNGNELILNANSWTSHFDPILNIIKNEFWHIIMAHGFFTNQDLSFLTNDIKSLIWELF